MKTYKCCACDQICELIEIDEGGYEEVWGAKVWVHMYTDVSGCCHEYYEEVEDESE